MFHCVLNLVACERIQEQRCQTYEVVILGLRSNRGKLAGPAGGDNAGDGPGGDNAGDGADGDNAGDGAGGVNDGDGAGGDDAGNGAGGENAGDGAGGDNAGDSITVRARSGGAARQRAASFVIDAGDWEVDDSFRFKVEFPVMVDDLKFLIWSLTGLPFKDPSDVYLEGTGEDAPVLSRGFLHDWELLQVAYGDESADSEHPGGGDVGEARGKKRRKRSLIRLLASSTSDHITSLQRLVDDDAHSVTLSSEGYSGPLAAASCP